MATGPLFYLLEFYDDPVTGYLNMGHHACDGPCSSLAIKRTTVSYIAVHPVQPTQETIFRATQLDTAANEQHPTFDSQSVKLGAGVSKWSFLIRMLPCVPSMVVPDLYALAERRADQVGCTSLQQSCQSGVVDGAHHLAPGG